MLRLRTFGGLALERDGTPVGGNASQRKRLSLLAYLAVESPAGVSRDKLVALLWPESDSERARGALSQALSTLRIAVGHDAIASGPTGDVRLHGAVVASDVADFRSALQRGDLAAASAAYGGPFLDGIFVRDAPDFERWVGSTRAQLEGSHQGVLEQLAKAADSRGDVDTAPGLWRRLAEGDPLSSRAALGLMRSLVGRGESEAAVRHGRAHESLVRAELGGPSDPAVASFIAQLLRAPPVAPVVEPKAESKTDVETEPTIVSAAVLLPVPPARPSVVHADSVAAAESAAAERQASPRSRHRTRTRLAVAVFGLSLLAAVPVALRLLPQRGSEPLVVNARRVIVDDFENRTGDPALDPLGAMLADWVTRGLQQTGVVDVVDPESRLSSARRLASRPEYRSGKGRAATVAREAGAGTVVTGAIYRQAGVLRYSASITDVVTETALATLDPVSAPISDPVAGAEQLRERVAGALTAALDTRIPPVTGPGNHPPTFAAYREYIRGLEAFQAWNNDVALKHFEASARLDTGFSTPLVWAMFAIWNGGGPGSIDSVLQQLARRRDRLAPLDVLALEFFQAGALDGGAKADEALYAAARLSPGSAWGFMAGQAAVAGNRPHEALRYLQRIDPEHGWVRGWWLYWRALTNAHHLLGQYEEELAATRRMRGIDPQNAMIPIFEGRALAASGRRDEALLALRAASSPENNPSDAGAADITGGALWKMGLEFRAHGYGAEATSAFEKALAWFQSPEAAAWVRADSGESETRRLDFRIAVGKLLYELGRWDEARRALEAIRRPAPYPYMRAEIRGWIGLAAARRGDRASAERSRAYLDSLVAQQMASTWALLASAEISELLGDRDRAIARLETLASLGEDLVYLELHRTFEMKALRADPRFIAIARPRQ